MAEYIIKSDETELPKGSYVYVIPITEAQPGQLVMFGAGSREAVSVGRWVPNIAGRNWVLQPKRWIREVETCRFVVLGVVVPVEAPPKEITDLTASECEAALKIARSLKGGA